MSKKCSQCRRSPAVYNLNGHPLCVDCAYKIQQMNYMQQVQNMQQMNWLCANMESMTGLPGTLPRFEIPKPPPIIQQQGGVTLNNINVEQSVIGSINTGNIGQIDVALSNIKNGGDTDLAEVIKEFTEAVLSASELTIDMKNEIIEQLSFLSGQAAVPEETRKTSIIRPILSTIGNSIIPIPPLTPRWRQSDASSQGSLFHNPTRAQFR